MGFVRRQQGRVLAAGVSALVRSGNTVRTNVEVVNLSRGGVFLRSFELFPLGAKVELHLEKRGLRRAVHVNGEVVSVKNKYESGTRAGPGMGIRFAPLSDDVRAQLETLLLQLAPGELLLEGDAPEGDGPPPRDWLEVETGRATATVPLRELELSLPDESEGAPEHFELFERGMAVNASVDDVMTTVPLTEGDGPLAREVARLKRALVERDAREKALEEKNQKLLEDLTKMRRALTVVSKR